MSHNKHRILGRDDFLHRLRLDSCLDTGALFDLLGLAAVVNDVVGHLDDRLISASSERKVNRVARELIVLRVGQPVHADADAERDRHFVADVHCFDVGKELEMRLLQLSQRLLPQNDQVLVLLDLAADAVDRRNIFVDLTVDQGSQERTADIFHAVKRFFVIVHVDEADDNALVIHFLNCQPDRRFVKQIQRDQGVLVAGRLDNVTVFLYLVERDTLHLNPVVAALVVNLQLHVLVRRGKGILRDGRENRTDRFAQDLLPVNNPVKCLVDPDNTPRIIEDSIGQIQLLEELFLHLSVFSGKTDHLVEQQNPAVQKLRYGDREINNQKYSKDNARRPADKVNQNIGQNHKKSQPERSVEISGELSLDLDSFFHRFPLPVGIRAFPRAGCPSSSPRAIIFCGKE